MDHAHNPNMHNQKMKGKMEILRAENLSVKYYASDYVLRNVNASIYEGELVLITGPSGCGKTTLLYCLSGIIPHCISVEDYGGKVFLYDKEIKNHPFSEIMKNSGTVLQNPTAQIFGMTVEEDIVFGLENLCYSREVIKKRLDEILKLVKLEKYRNSDPHDLSGGEKQRLVIASVLAMNPRILFLDEPTSNLDPRGTREVLLTLEKLRRAKTIVLVERKIEHIAPYVDRIIALNDGQVVFNSDPREFFSNMKLVEKLGVNAPQVVRLAQKLKEMGVGIKGTPLTVDELRTRLSKIVGGASP